MENNVNSNVGVNTNTAVNTSGGGNVNGGVVNNVPNSTVNLGATNNVNTMVNPTAVNPAATNLGTNVNIATNAGVVNSNGGQKNMKKFYIWMGVFVGLVLVIAIILLIFLLNGSIQNRNRLTCNKVTQEVGYTYSIQKYYIFDDDVMQRVNFTYKFEYTNGLTDDMYNQEFDEIINNETYGSTKYGLATNIKKEGNVVTITAYEPSYWGESFKEIKSTNANEGYTCE